jgi:hypothetical protein
MKIRKAVIAGLLSALFLSAAAPAMAQGAATPAQSSAPGSPRPAASPQMKADRHALRQACAADTQKFCSNVAAGGGKVLQCLRSHRAEISAACQSAWGQLQTDRKAMR